MSKRRCLLVLGLSPALGILIASCTQAETGETLGEASDAVQSEQVVVCHVPHGHPEQAFLLTIDQSALAGHLAHGDNNRACLVAGCSREGDTCASDAECCAGLTCAGHVCRQIPASEP